MSGVQERAARAARTVGIGPFGPHATAMSAVGKRVLLNRRESEEIAAAVLAVVADVDGIAGVLAGHHQVAGQINAPTSGPLGYGTRVWCSCGWSEWSEVLPGDMMDAHCAEAVAAYIAPLAAQAADVGACGANGDSEGGTP